MMQLNEAVAGAAMSSLYPEMRFSWEIKSVDALFCNGMTRVGDLSREAILASLRECDLSVLKDEVNKNLFNDKKFCKECITVCVKYTQKLELVEEMIDFLYAASEETRYVELYFGRHKYTVDRKMNGMKFNIHYYLIFENLLHSD